MIRTCCLLTMVLALQADEPGFILEGQLARDRKGLDATYVSISTRDVWDISWDASLSVVDPGKGRNHEYRVALGLGGYGREGMGFLELIAAGGGPWGGGLGLRARAAWRVVPHVYAGGYATCFAGASNRGEVGLTLGVHLP